MINAIILDDENLAIDLTKNFLERSGKPVNLLESFNSSEKALPYIINNQPEILILDMQMPGFNGFEVLKKSKYNPIVIMITAYSEYAQVAYDLDIVDYVMKPFTFQRFEKALGKAIEVYEIKNRKSDIGDKIIIKHDGLKKAINISDIIYIEALKQYVRIHTPENKYIVHERLINYEKKLCSKNFIRVHKSYVVNMEKRISVTGGNIIIDNLKIPIGRKYKGNIS